MILLNSRRFANFNGAMGRLVLVTSWAREWKYQFNSCRTTKATGVYVVALDYRYGCNLLALAFAAVLLVCLVIKKVCILIS